jgi:hypothetical protein
LVGCRSDVALQKLGARGISALKAERLLGTRHVAVATSRYLPGPGSARSRLAAPMVVAR